jgi:hypothetical protein
MWLASGVLRNHGKNDFSMIEKLLAFFARDELAVWRKN